MPILLNPPEFHCHQDSLDSASTPEAFAKREIDLGTGTLTVTDHGTMAACRRVYDLAHGKKYKGKLTPILGLEGYLRDDACPILLANGIEQTKADKDGKAINPHFAAYLKYTHFTMHYMDEAAFRVGSQILSRADGRAEKHGSERKPLFSWADMEELGAQNVTLGSGCLIGGVQRHIMQYGRYDIAEQYYQKMRSLVRPGNFYVEVFPHVCDRNWDASVTITFEDGTSQKLKKSKRVKCDKVGSGKKGKDGWWVAQDLAEAWHRASPQKRAEFGSLREIMEDRKGVPVENPKKITDVQSYEGFVLNDCSAWSPNGDLQYGCNLAVIELAKKYGDKIVISGDSHFTSPDEKIVQDIRLSQGGSWRFHNSYHRMSGEECWSYFRDVLKVDQAQVEGWVDNNYEWSTKFKDFKFTERKALPTSFYPEDTLQHTYKLIGEHGRMENSVARMDRLNAEVKLLHENGKIDLLPYMFIDEDVVSYYVRMGRLTGPGRGSAAGLQLAWLLDITHVDPMKYGLSMDRFMTPDRIAQGKLPDIDQDLGGRDILEGWSEPGFRVTLEDGSIKDIPAKQVFKTIKGPLTIKQAFDAGVEIDV